MKYILLIMIIVGYIYADDIKLYKTLQKTLENQKKANKDIKINKIYLKNIKEDNITKNIQALMKIKKK